VTKYVNDENHQATNSSFNYTDSTHSIKLWVYGLEFTKLEIDSLQYKLASHKLASTKLTIYNMGSYKTYQNIFKQNDNEIRQKSERINSLETQLSIQNVELNTLLFRQRKMDQLLIDTEDLTLNMDRMYEGKLKVDYSINRHFNQADSNMVYLPSFMVQFHKSVWRSKRVGELIKLDSILREKYKYQLDTLVCIEK
jgi:hypothetical protein